MNKNEEKGGCKIAGGKITKIKWKRKALMECGNKSII